MSDDILTKAKNYLFQNGGSSIYCLSALSIIWGIYQIMSPVLLTEQILEKVLSIGSLYLYEIALIGCFIFLLIRERLRTASLIIILAIFYMSSGIILNSLAGDDAMLSLYLGAALSAFSLLKLWLLKKHGQLNFPRLELLGIITLSIINFMLPGYLALRLENNLSSHSLWRYSLLGAFVCLVINFKPRLDPLIRNNFTLEKLFLLIISFVNLLNFLALDYIFSVTYTLRDFFPLIFIGFFYFIDAYCIKLKEVRFALALCPAVILFISEFYWKFNMELLQVPGLLALCTAGCLFLWKKYRYDSLAYGAIFYSTIMIYMDIFKAHHYRSSAIFIFAAYATILAWSCYRKHLLGLIFFAFTVSFHLVDKVPLREILRQVNWDTGSSFFTFFAIILLILNRLSHKDKLADQVIMIMLAGALFFLPANLALSGSIFCLSLAFCYIKTLNNKVAGLIILTPLSKHLITFVQNMTGWHYVAFSFILLSVGTWLNLRKAKKGTGPKQERLKTQV
ncbi:hypothetical protein LNTAR_19015 [Lentisphaera araneosa HTCC2155]|uniref:Uncharacterized protein n=1 Tax=Lentisphaera araneosa HTCC2155 TaxID=313628 RepID=A6DNV9_9BACT|nr:hypothetical protein [Lentisphaera araneosa]EDM26768.1 hypothetical protein LNTAR_19015 [Lentisphaera araneosa HTCC2155]